MWTLLIILTTDGPLEGIQTGILYASAEACEQALDVVSASIDYPHEARCYESDIGAREKWTRPTTN